ncbi:MAG: PAS domain S-box protein [Rhodocyclaceae bacterium]|nr:PAS domain S-box protein [Rhodocyclaceae bacterium]
MSPTTNRIEPTLSLSDKKKLQEKAVREALAGRPLLELAVELGVSTTTLRRWMSESGNRTKASDKARKVAASLSKEKRTEASQRMRLLIHALEQSPATIIVTDAEGHILYANPKFTETTGYVPEEVLGKTPSFLKSGYTPTEEYGKLWKTIRAGREWRGEFRNKRKDGSLYWERASISPVFDAKGNIANFMAVKENITEIKEADMARQQAVDRFRAVVMAMVEGVLLMEAEGRIILCNEAAETLLGCELGCVSLVGKRLLDLNLRWLSEGAGTLSVEEHPARRILEVQKGGEALRRVIYTLLLPSGGVRRLSLNAGLVPGENLSRATVVVTLNDITKENDE